MAEKTQAMAARHFTSLIAMGKAKLSRSMAELLRSHPFHGHIAAGWRARPDTDVPTMGVCWACGGIQLIWNPSFVNEISDMELAGVLLHEVHHVVFRHLFLFPERAAPTPEFDSFAALVAEEVTVNEFVSLPLPGAPMRLEQFQSVCPSLEPYQSTRDRYRRLYDPARARRDFEERQQFETTVEEQLEATLAREGIAAGSCDKAGKCSLPDSHAAWGSFEQAGATAALAVSVATAQAMAKHGGSLSPELRETIEQTHAAIGKLPGSMPGGVLETLAGRARAKLPWQKILRRLLAVDHDTDRTYLRPPRRFPELVGVLPGPRRMPMRLKILAAIDTSGSMEPYTLDEIAAELRVMTQTYDVSVVEFDAAIQRRYRLGPSQLVCQGEDPLSAMQGRGGTNFCPVFEPDTLAWAADGGELSGLVVFTDGYGPAPEIPPREQVVWILMGADVEPPASWGSVVMANGSSPPTAAGL
jgi:predicted metal-dependent peptidase